MDRSVIQAQYEELLGSCDCPEVFHVFNELSRCAADFLSSVPQSRKFSHREVTDTLINSALGAPRFSGTDAALCFERLERMVKNVAMYKWRMEEYHYIRKHTPFYENVSNVLSDIDGLLWLAGYRPLDETCLELKVTVADEDLRRLAFDYFLANIECQLLQTIFNSVNSERSCSWKEVVDCRLCTIGEVGVCCKKLTGRISLSNHCPTTDRHDGLDAAGRCSLEIGPSLRLPSSQRDVYNPSGGPLAEPKPFMPELSICGNVPTGQTFGDPLFSCGTSPFSSQSVSVEEKAQPWIDFGSGGTTGNVPLSAKDDHWSLRKLSDKLSELNEAMGSQRSQGAFIPRLANPGYRECPKCQMLNNKNCLLCNYCDYYFTN